MSVAEANALDAGLDSRVGFGAIVLSVFSVCAGMESESESWGKRKALIFFSKSKASQLCERYVSQQATPFEHFLVYRLNDYRRR